MSQFDDNAQAIEELVASTALTSEALSAESNRALTSENYFSQQFNPNPLYAVDELVPVSALDESLLGTAFMALSSYGRYANGHMYLVVNGEEEGSFTYQDITDY